MSYTPRRKFDKYWQAHIKKLATTVGEVVLAMNLLQAMLFAVFWKLLDLTPNEEREPFEVRLYVTIDQAQNIWNAIAKPEPRILEAHQVAQAESGLLGEDTKRCGASRRGI
jgi:hypothetical protein